MKPRWVDSTTHFAGDPDRTPKTWSIHGNKLASSVTRHRDRAPDTWVCHCAALGVKEHELRSRDLTEAKNEALLYLLGLLEDMKEDIVAFDAATALAAVRQPA